MNHALPRRLASVAVVGAVTVAGAGAAHAATVGHTSPGTIRLYATDSGSARSPILFTGVVGDYGTVLSTDRSGRPDPNGTRVVVHLQQGSFRIDATHLNQASKEAHFHADQATCSGWVVATASLPISGGTGRYRGIHGTVRVTDTYALVAARFPSGPRKGRCEPNGRPLSQYGSITGVGRVTLP